MINKELFYKVTLIDCNRKELEVAKFLQILTGMEKTETRRIVASLPCVLYEKLDGEACSYIEEALDFYTARYKFEPVGDEKEVYEVDPSVYPSKQVIALGSMVDYIGKRSEFVSIARKYDFPKNVSLNDTPFLVKDGLAEEQAVNLRQDLRNMGMFALIMRSGAEVQQVKKRGFLAGVFAR